MSFECWIPKATDTHTVFNTYCLPMATVAMPSCLNVMFYVHCLSCIICWSCFKCSGKQYSCHLLDECEVKGRSVVVGLQVVVLFSGNMSCGLRRVVGECGQARLFDCVHVHGWSVHGWSGGIVVISVYFLMLDDKFWCFWESVNVKYWLENQP